jgi:hypothetical protein
MRWFARQLNAAATQFERGRLPLPGWLGGIMSAAGLALFLAAIAFGGNASQIVAADEPPPTATIRASNPLPTVAEPSIEEIARIRQSVGAVIPSITNDDHLFVDALRRVAQPTAPVTADRALTTDIQANADSRAAADDDSQKPLDTFQLAIASLRNSARELDLQAYEFDEQQRRSESKRLRRLAQSLRREAERLEDSQLESEQLGGEQLKGQQLNSRRPSAGRSTLVTPMDTSR